MDRYQTPMARIVKSSLSVSLIGAVLIIALYILTMGDHLVPKTVAEDSSLPRVELNGMFFHAEVFGNPSYPAVIVVHGGPGADYRSLLPLNALSDEFYMVFYDQRGSGLSPRVAADQLNIDTFVADLNAFIDHFGQGESVKLIGHSWGGGLAAIYVARYPEKVNQLVLAEPVPLTASLEAVSKVSYGPSLDFSLIIPGVFFWLQSLHIEGADGHSRNDYLFTHMAPRANPEHHCGKRMASPDTALWRFGVLAMRSMRQSLLDQDGNLRGDLIDGIETYDKEVLFITGSCSGLLGPAFQSRQIVLFSNAQMVEIGNAGHMMFTDQPDESIAALRAFLNMDLEQHFLESKGHDRSLSK